MWHSISFPFVHLACRWLLPWVAILATSTLIAHAAGAMLAPAKAIETDTRGTANVQYRPMQVDDRSASVTAPAIEANGALTRVHCPSDPDVTTDVYVVSLQDLDLLMSSVCVVRPRSAG
jgi:hypothetical protein